MCSRTLSEIKHRTWHSKRSTRKMVGYWTLPQQMLSCNMSSFSWTIWPHLTCLFGQHVSVAAVFQMFTWSKSFTLRIQRVTLSTIIQPSLSAGMFSSMGQLVVMFQFSSLANCSMWIHSSFPKSIHTEFHSVGTSILLRMLQSLPEELWL